MIKGSPLYGYQLDISTLEEVNFYLDPDSPIPQFKEREELLDRLKKGRRAFVLMTKKGYETIKASEGWPFLSTQEFPYKKERLVLASTP